MPVGTPRQDARCGKALVVTRAALGAGSKPNVEMGDDVKPPNSHVAQRLAAVHLRDDLLCRIVMPSLLLAGDLKLTVPLVESLPGAADVSVVRADVTLGGNLTYYERRHGKTVAYRPKSVVLPKTCPREGFRFSATFSFLDGTQAVARRTVACPRHR
jgi:hypothetical protein